MVLFKGFVLHSPTEEIPQVRKISCTVHKQFRTTHLGRGRSVCRGIPWENRSNGWVELRERCVLLHSWNTSLVQKIDLVPHKPRTHTVVVGRDATQQGTGLKSLGEEHYNGQLAYNSMNKRQLFLNTPRARPISLVYKRCYFTWDVWSLTSPSTGHIIGLSRFPLITLSNTNLTATRGRLWAGK